jgi:hypothetical protein
VRRHGSWVYLVRGGRVAAVATASRSLARRPRALAAAMRRLAAGRARAKTGGFEPSAALPATASPPTGQPLAGTGNATADASLALLCRFQISALADTR